MDNPFKQLFSGDKLRSLIHSDLSKSALGIDIGSSAIKVVQLRNKGGKAVLETYGSLSLGPYANTDIGQVTNLDAEATAKALLDVMKEANVTTTSVAIAIPSSSSLIFLITLPTKVPESQLGSIIPIEARKYIPVPISEVTLDWWAIPEQAESGTASPEAKVETLVVAIHNETLTRYRDILAKTKLDSDFFEMEVFSSIRASISHEVVPIVIIDFGAAKTKLSIVEYGIVRNFHVVNRGSQDITRNIAQALSIPFAEAERLKREVGLDEKANPKVAEIVRVSIEYIFAEISTVVLAYEKKYNKTISKIILTGGGALTRGLFESATEKFHSEVVYSDPLSKTEAPAFLETVLATSGPEFSVAIGLALRQLS